MDKRTTEAQEAAQDERIDNAVKTLKARHGTEGPLTVDASEFFAAMDE